MMIPWARAAAATGAGGGAGGGLAIGEHHDDLRVAGVGVKEPNGFVEGIRVVGAAPSHQGIHRVLQSIHRGDHLGVLHGSVGKTDDANVAARADLPRGLASGGLRNDIDKGLCPGLHVGQGGTGHAPRAVQHQRNVCGVGDDIRGRSEGQGHPQRPIAVNPFLVDDFVRVCNPHSYYLLLRQRLIPVYALGGRG